VHLAGPDLEVDAGEDFRAVNPGMQIFDLQHLISLFPVTSAQAGVQSNTGFPLSRE
jgi:hypothetical protein